ncbi:Smr/MutS family protein [Castellaniella caeni]
MKHAKPTLADLRRLQAAASQLAHQQDAAPAAQPPRPAAVRRNKGMISPGQVQSAAETRQRRQKAAAHATGQEDAPARGGKRAQADTQARGTTSAQAGTQARATGQARPDAPGRVPPDAPLLDAADRALFRQAMRFVQPLPDHGPRARALAHRDPDTLLQARREHAQGGPEPAARARPARHRPRQAQAFDPDAEAFLQPGCGPDLLRGLRRDKWVAQATLDLHGSTLEEAQERLERFLLSCLEHDVRCVRIIHGKGIGSHQGESVLRAPIRQHLCRLEAVQAWVQSKERDGGAGAVTVLLRLPHKGPAE